MRIREIGRTLHLMRYAGYDKEGKKGIESKIGAIGINCLPIVLDEELPSNSDAGIPRSLWRKLTIEEQEKLMEELKARELKQHQESFRLVAIRMKLCVDRIDAVTPELANELWERMGELQKALKKAGHPKPHHADKTGEKAPSGLQDTRTIPMALDVPTKA